MKTEETKHLIRDRCRDEHGVWCDGEWYGGSVAEPADATCEACLLAAFEFGIKAMRQRLFLKKGALLNMNQSIEKLLHQLATPVVFVSEGKKPT